MNTLPPPRQYHHGNLRAALLDAAERSLRARGVAQLSLRDLARDVGVSHAAPRRHFVERQDLLDALAEAGYARLGAQIHNATAEETADFATLVHAAASAFVHFASENAALLEVMNAAKHGTQSSEVPRASEVAYAPILRLIHRGQAEGALRPGKPEEIGLILYATMNGIATLVNTSAVHASRLDRLTRIAVEQFLRGAS
ncbi:TetR/AcrR family transcriptional regulator [Curtobacterium sp. MWU13-2055]|uniref:TetR/AcrR family transcriptional regulator n=1 Tax=Curtobacterium sp. MWU13-2055 TaxID=2931928 RepID=UPI002010B16D|nr:TetR/AcrR family transcriptional regulator [Curtobacterium sp. MWU13-2055]